MIRFASDGVDTREVTRWLRTEVERFSYKPGCEFEVFTAPSPTTLWEFAVTITIVRPDAGGGGRTVRIAQVAMVPWLIIDQRDVGRLAEWLLSRIEELEIHEAREWFKRDGMPVCDPHAERGAS